MDNQAQPNIPPVQPIPQASIPPSTNWFKIMLFVILGLIISTGLVFAGIQLGKKQLKILSTANNLTAITPSPIISIIPTTINSPTPFHLSIPSQQPTTIVKSIQQQITLKIAAIGGGGSGERYDYKLTFNTEPEDQLVILKADVNEIKYSPGYNQGAFDKGLVIKHGTVELEISPSFEGAGTGIENKLNPVIISNSKLATGPIFRLKEKDVMGAQNSQGGSDYTTQYSEDPEVCKAFNQSNGTSYPSCISSGFQVFTINDSALFIHCSAEDEKAIWCDEIVKSLNVTVKKY